MRLEIFEVLRGCRERTWSEVEGISLVENTVPFAVELFTGCKYLKAVFGDLAGLIILKSSMEVWKADPLDNSFDVIFSTEDPSSFDNDSRRFCGNVDVSRNKYVLHNSVTDLRREVEDAWPLSVAANG